MCDFTDYLSTKQGALQALVEAGNTKWHLNPMQHAMNKAIVARVSMADMASEQRDRELVQLFKDRMNEFLHEMRARDGGVTEEEYLAGRRVINDKKALPPGWKDDL